MEALMTFGRFVMVVSALLATPALAQKSNHEEVNRQLNRMELSTRIEQRCNGRATGVTQKEGKLHAPEEVIAYAFSDDRIDGASVVAPGAAIKDGDKWYHIQYQCTTSEDGLKIRSFAYHLGNEVPRRDWRKYNLSP